MWLITALEGNAAGPGARGPKGAGVNTSGVSSSHLLRVGDSVVNLS